MQYLFFKCSGDNLLITTLQMSYLMSEGLLLLDLTDILSFKCFLGLKKTNEDMGATDECQEMDL